MNTVTSQDGTGIAYEQSGTGPALILVLGAFNERPTGAPLSQFLASQFTVINYDRRGRGDSTDTAPYAVEREIEDLAALIAAAGGSACVFGYSSVDFVAAADGLAIAQLALYDPPPTGGRTAGIASQLSELIAAGDRGAAVELFQTDVVGIPAEIVARLRHAPFRPALEKIAHTLVYDSTILSALPDGLAASVSVPVLVLHAENNAPIMHQSAQGLADALPQGEYRALAGQSHDIVPEVTGPVVAEFFLSH